MVVIFFSHVTCGTMVCEWEGGREGGREGEGEREGGRET